MGFASPPFVNSCFCHCLYMDIFKKYPGKLCTVGRMNGLWWKQSAEAIQRQAILFVIAVCYLSILYSIFKIIIF